MDQAGVLYWQAPEIRLGPYDPLKVDVWSLGATVWEMAETSPPFSNEGKAADAREMSVVLDDRWPPLSNPRLYSPAFQDFLMDCSEPAESRPDPEELAKVRALPSTEKLPDTDAYFAERVHSQCVRSSCDRASAVAVHGHREAVAGELADMNLDRVYFYDTLHSMCK